MKWYVSTTLTSRSGTAMAGKDEMQHVTGQGPRNAGPRQVVG